MLKPTIMVLLLSVLFSLQIQANPVACRYFYEPIDDLDNITMDTRNAMRDPLWHGPLVVLVDHASASSSEGLAAALSSHRRAIIVGSETYGKGTMQNYTESSEGALYKYTSAYFYSPTGRPIQWNGAPIDIPLIRTNEGLNYSERSGFNSLTPVRLSGQLPKIDPAFSEPKTADEIEELNTREAYHILADWINLE